MESELRWILILISIIVLTCIVFDGWRRIQRQKSEIIKPNSLNLNSEDHLDDDAIIENDDHHEHQVLWTEPVSVSRDEAPKQVADQTIFILNIHPENGKVFTGSHLLPTLLTLGMRHGDHSIFHRHEQISGNGKVLFSLAAAYEPGIFNLDSMESEEYLGLTLFFQVPGPAHPTNALNLMLQTAKRLVQILGGKLCDENHQHLSENVLEREYQTRLRYVLGQA